MCMFEKDIIQIRALGKATLISMFHWKTPVAKNFMSCEIFMLISGGKFKMFMTDLEGIHSMKIILAISLLVMCFVLTT